MYSRNCNRYNNSTEITVQQYQLMDKINGGSVVNLITRPRREGEYSIQLYTWEVESLQVSCDPISLVIGVHQLYMLYNDMS